MTMFRTRACALIAALLLPLPVLAAPTVNTLGGDTRVQLSGDLVGALTSLGVHGMTICEVRGFGRQKGHTEMYRGTEYAVDFVPKVKIEVVCSDKNLALVIDTIMRAAQTGQIGDGKIFVYDLGRAVRIRTGETDNDAL